MASKTKQIGDVGEQVLITEFIRKGITVLKPIGDNEPFDFVILINNNFLKVQAKTTEYIKNDIMIFRTSITNPHRKTNRKYTETEVDLFGLYCMENDYVGLMTMDEYTSKDTAIRIIPPKNNRMTKVKMAEDYSFDVQFDKLLEKYNNA